MSVSTTASSQQYSGVTAGVPLNFNYPVHADTEISVVIVNTENTVAVPTTDYVVTLADDFASCTITPTASLVTKCDGDDIIVKRTLPLTTDLNIPINSRLNEQRVTKEFDRTVMRFQQLKRQIEEVAALVAAEFATREETRLRSSTTKMLSPRLLKYGLTDIGILNFLNEYPLADRDFGTDQTDNLQAFFDMLTPRGLTGVVPAGVYKVNGSLIVPGNGTYVRCHGPMATTFKSANADNDIIGFQDGVAGGGMEYFGVDRSVVARAADWDEEDPGALGVWTPRDAFVQINLRQIYSRRSGTNFLLGPAALAHARELIGEYGVSHNFVQTNSAAGGGTQWYCKDCYNGAAGDKGWLIRPHADATGGMAPGEHHDIQSFLNGSYGFAAEGRADAPIPAIRYKSNIFSGQNGKASLYLNTFGTNHEIQGLHAEEDGTIATGPGANAVGSPVTLPASWDAHGLEITENNGDVRLGQVLSNGAARNGIRSKTPRLHTDGNVYCTNNGRAFTDGGVTPEVPADQCGAYIEEGTLCGPIKTVGSSDPAQKWGVGFGEDNAHHMTGHDLRGNSEGPIYSPTTLTELMLSGGAPAQARTTDVVFPQAALSVVSGDAAPDPTLTNQATVYLVQKGSRFIPVWNGYFFTMVPFANNIALSLNDVSFSPAISGDGTNQTRDYWAFGHWETETVKLAQTKWSTNTARGTGVSEIEWVNGLPVNKNAIANAAGTYTIPARGALHMGTVYANVSALVDYNFKLVDVNGTDVVNRCAIGLWNRWQRRNIVMQLYTSQASWTYNAQTVRRRDAGAAHAGVNDKFAIVSGEAEDDMLVNIETLFNSAAASVAFRTGIGLDDATAYFDTYRSNLTQAAGGFPGSSLAAKVPKQLGYHDVNILESIQQAASSGTKYGGRDKSSCYLSWRA
jgi:hypothetical protein